VRVASKVGNLHSKFGHARPLGSRNIRYVRDERTDRRTKASLIAPFPTVGGIIIQHIYFVENSFMKIMCLKFHNDYVNVRSLNGKIVSNSTS